MVTIETHGEVVMLGSDAKWHGASPALLKKLEVVSAGVDPSGADPSPATTIAEAAIRAFGGRIVKAAKPEGVPGRIYSAV